MDLKLKFNSDGLIPAIAQDYKTGEVLMLAYMNQEAFDLTVKTGKGTYFSRSRQSLWVKGETSGHFQYVKEIRYDCDCDTILLLLTRLVLLVIQETVLVFIEKLKILKEEKNNV